MGTVEVDTIDCPLHCGQGNVHGRFWKRNMNYFHGRLSKLCQRESVKSQKHWFENVFGARCDGRLYHGWL